MNSTPLPLKDQLAKLDPDLHAKGIPVVLRPLDAFHALIGREDRNDATLQSFNEITSWYIEKYGAGAIWDGMIGTQPVLIREALYMAKVPFTMESVTLKLTDYIDNLPGPVASSLTEQEFHEVSSLLLPAAEDFGALYNLETKPSLLSGSQRALVRRAWFDLRNAAATLKEDTQGSIFHSHQAAEKFVKAALCGAGFSLEAVKKFQHNLYKATRKLSEFHSKFATTLPWAQALDGLLGGMESRYSEMIRSQTDGISAFTLARSMCSFLAKQWQLDSDRGTPDLEFEVGKYYRDYSGRKYRFNGRHTDNEGRLTTLLMLLEYGPPEMLFDAEMRCVGSCGFYYVPITDLDTVSRLEDRYRSLTLK